VEAIGSLCTGNPFRVGTLPVTANAVGGTGADISPGLDGGKSGIEGLYLSVGFEPDRQTIVYSRRPSGGTAPSWSDGFMTHCGWRDELDGDSNA
jgi:hypothetical protein